MEKQPAQIKIENLKLRTYIGFSEHEKDILQDVTINISFSYDISEAVKTDSPRDVFNYRTLTKEIISEVQKSRFNLLESLTAMIYNKIRQNYQLFGICVKVDKPHALRFSDNVSCKISD